MKKKCGILKSICDSLFDFEIWSDGFEIWVFEIRVVSNNRALIFRILRNSNQNAPGAVSRNRRAGRGPLLGIFPVPIPRQGGSEMGPHERVGTRFKGAA